MHRQTREKATRAALSAYRKLSIRRVPRDKLGPTRVHSVRHLRQQCTQCPRVLPTLTRGDEHTDILGPWQLHTLLPRFLSHVCVQYGRGSLNPPVVFVQMVPLHDVSAQLATAEASHVPTRDP